ncbi:MAG: Patatin [Acidimicrobiales bacterium]|nr:Patatin [Acidimicrobiales bacterium]
MSVIRLFSDRRKMRTVFVLGGGGNLGAVQVGMLRAVIERGVVPDLLLGSSVGALNAAAVAADASLDGVESLDKAWRAINGDDLMPGHLSGLWQLARKSRSVHHNDGLRRLIDRAIPFEQFEDAPVPFQVVATSLRTGREQWFARGRIVEPILASAALPGVFPPVEIDGELFIDGGVVDNVPMTRAATLGATRMYVFHVGNFDRPRPDPKRPIDVLLQAFSISRNYRFLAEMQDPPEGVEMICLPAVDPGSLRRNDFARSAQLIDRAYANASAFLDQYAAVVGE